MKFTAIVYDYNALHTDCFHMEAENKNEAIKKIKIWINGSDDFGIFGICEGHITFDKVDGYDGMNHSIFSG